MYRGPTKKNKLKMCLYKIVEFLMREDIDVDDVDKTISNILKIEGKDKAELVDARKRFELNTDTIFNGFNDVILNMNIKPQDWFKDSDIAIVFGVSITTVKSWRKSGALKYDQSVKNGSVKVSINALNDFVREHPKYEKKWKLR